MKGSVIFMHGMGSPNTNYYKPFAQTLKTVVSRRDYEQIHMEPIFYDDVFKDLANEYISRVKEKYPQLLWDDLRALVINTLGDAGHISRDTNVYKVIFKKFTDAVENCFKKAGKNAPITILSHSLGCQFIFNFLWDMQKNSGVYGEFLEAIQTFITIGCNLPLFNFSISDPKNFERLNSVFSWHNLFYEADILGYPVKLIGDSYNQPWIYD